MWFFVYVKNYTLFLWGCEKFAFLAVGAKNLRDAIKQGRGLQRWEREKAFSFLGIASFYIGSCVC